MDRRFSARRYAQAVFEIALERKQLARCHSDLQKVARLSRDKDTVAFLKDTEVHFEDKAKRISDNLGDIDPLVLNLAHIVKEYQRLVDNYHGIERAKVTTAVPLDDEDWAKLRQSLSDLVGRTVVFEPEVDPGLIGGFVVRVAGKLLDGSTRSQLATLKRNLS